MTAFDETTVENAALDWLQGRGWEIASSQDALAKLSPNLPAALGDAFRKLTRPEGSGTVACAMRAAAARGGNWGWAKTSSPSTTRWRPTTAP